MITELISTIKAYALTQIKPHYWLSDANSYEARAHIYDLNGSRIDSVHTLKALGFIFNSRADVSDQIDTLCKRFRSTVEPRPCAT